MNQNTTTTVPAPVQRFVGRTFVDRLEVALDNREAAFKRIKEEQRAVSGTNLSRIALDAYRNEYNECHDHLMLLLETNARNIAWEFRAIFPHNIKDQDKSKNQNGLSK